MSSKNFPSTIEEVTPVWLSDALKNAGMPGVEIRDIQVEIIGEGVGIMGLLYRAKLSYSESSSEGPNSVVIKVPSPHEQTRHIARAFMFYGKEIGFYRDAACLLYTSDAADE